MMTRKEKKMNGDDDNDNDDCVTKNDPSLTSTKLTPPSSSMDGTMVLLFFFYHCLHSFNDNDGIISCNAMKALKTFVTCATTSPPWKCLVETTLLRSLHTIIYSKPSTSLKLIKFISANFYDWNIVI